MMKTNNEIFDIVMARKDEYETQRTARNKRIAAAGTGVIVIVVCVGIGVAAQKGRVPVAQAGGDNQAEKSAAMPAGNMVEQTAVTRPNDPTVGNEAVIFPPDQDSEITQTSKIYGGANVPDEGTDRAGAPWKPDPIETTTAALKDGAGSTYGGDTQSGGWMIPATPDAAGAKPGVKLVGEKITDAEAKTYLAENTWLSSALASSGVPTDNITFTPTGYCHVSYDGTDGKQLEVREDFRDYLAYNNGKLIAIITITKENGKLSATPAFGGAWFDDYDAFLKAHKGEKLLYVYAGWMEIVITPDSKCCNPQGSDVSAYMEGLEDPYAYFYSETATYTP